MGEIRNLIFFLTLKKIKKSDFYEKESILVSEESNIIAGLLVGLNALDISIDLKSDAVNLDFPVNLQLTYDLSILS